MAVEHATHYANVEKELVSLLQKVTYWLSRQDLAEAAEFIAAREYGLALEAITEGLRETGHLDAGTVQWIMKLAREMEIENQPFVKALAR